MCLTAGTLAAIGGTVGTGLFVELLGSFQGFILLTAILYLLSALFYNIYATGERVDFDTTGPSLLLFSGLCCLLFLFCFIHFVSIFCIILMGAYAGLLSCLKETTKSVNRWIS